MTHYNLLQRALALSLFAALSCGPTPTAEAPRCLKLSQPAGSDGLTTGKPARVSLFFSIDTCDGKPVSGLEATAFDISEDGKSVSPFESERSIEPKGQRYQMSSLLLLDLSGSELRAGQFPQLEEAVGRYLHAVLQRPGDGQRVALMTFDGRAQPQLLVDYTDNLAALQAGLASLETVQCAANADCAGFADHQTCAGWRCVDDSTNLNGAVVQALDSLDAQVALDSGIAWRDGSLVVFTDGTDQAARVTQEAALSRVHTAKAHLFTVGLGGEVDEASLRALGPDGYYPAAQPTQLAQAFEAIATRVTSMANRFYLLEYCSPKRNGLHTLRITATLADGAKTPLVGDLTGQFDATGFSSGCTLSGR